MNKLTNIYIIPRNYFKRPGFFIAKKNCFLSEKYKVEPKELMGKLYEKIQLT